MKKVLFIFLLFLGTALSAQSNIDSLKQLLHQTKDDTTLLNTYLDLAKSYIDINVDSSRKYATIALEPSQKLNYYKGITNSINLLGNCEQRKGNLDSAMLYYEEYRKMAIANSDDKGMAIVLNNIGIIYMQKGQYNDALAAYFEAIDFEKKVGDQRGLAQGLNNIGVVHYHMGDIANTLVYLKKSTEITKEIGDLQILKKGYINIGAIHKYNKEYEEALEFYNKGLEISKQLNDLSEITICYHNLADLFAEQEKYKDAETYYREALAFHEKFENKRGIALEYLNLGSLYRKQKLYPIAEEYFLKSIRLASGGEFLNIVEAAFQGLANLYSEQGQFKKAYEAMEDFIEIKDSLVNLENSRSFAELRTQYETAEKEKELAEEKAKTESLAKEKAEVELTASKRKRWISGLLALVLIIVSVSLSIVQRNKRNAQAEKDAALLKERDKGIQAVFDAQEEERKRISKDLHDGIGQQLSGLKMAFQKLGKNATNEGSELGSEMERLSSIISDSADEVRSISHQMMPKALTELGLIEALEDMLTKSLQLNKIEYEFEHYGISSRLTEQQEIGLYRIAQELINNIIKHSEATSVSLQLFKNNNKIILVVEDNGKGIGTQNKDGHGLMNIKSRLNVLNGEFNFEASPNSGTLTTIRIPI